MIQRSSLHVLLAATTLTLSTTVQAQSGTLDTTFDPGTGVQAGADPHIGAVEVLPDGKVLIAGLFSTYNGQAAETLVRLNADGSLDPTFTVLSAWISNSYVFDLAQQPDGKILVGGQFVGVNGGNSIIRLNADGTVDPSFVDASPAFNMVRVITLQPDGKVLIGGRFATYGGANRLNLARLEADGSLDVTFNAGGGGAGVTNQTTQEVNDIAVEPDGRILISGSFTEYMGLPQTGLARLHADGSLDNSLNIGTGIAGAVNSIDLYPDGRIFLAGNFTQYNGAGRNRVARIAGDGTLDTLFNPALFTAYPSISGANGAVFTSILQSDGRIIIGGTFDKYNNVFRRSIVRLEADGSTDPTFVVGLGIQNDGDVLDMALQADHKVVVGGYFSQYNSVGRNNIMRLHGDVSTWVEPIDDQKGAAFALFPNPAQDLVTLSGLPDDAWVNVIDPTGRPVHQTAAKGRSMVLDLARLAPGTYVVQVRDRTGADSRVLVIGR